MSRLWVVWSLLVLCLLPCTAAAEGTPPDLVLKKDGTVMRGTISEAVPNEFVEIVLPTGETRRVDAKDITFAGPADRAPGATASAEDSSDEGSVSGDGEKASVPVSVEGSEPDLTVYQEAARANFVALTGAGAVAMTASAYAPVCTAPCKTKAEPGTYTLGLSRKDGQVVLGEPIEIEDRPSDIRAEYVSRSGTRTAGWVVLGGSLVLGTYLIVDSIGTKEVCSDPTPQSCASETDLSLSELLLGSGVLVAGPIVGVILAATPDKAHFTVRPAVGPRSTAGITLRGRF